MDAARSEAQGQLSSEAATMAFAAASDVLWRKSGAPGMTAAFVLPDGSVFQFAFGFRDIEGRTPMPLRARMLGGSTGKSIFAATALDLAMERLLDLDAPVARCLGRAAWFSRLPNAQDLTLRKLLMHSSGIGDHMGHPEIIADLKARRERSGPDAIMQALESVEYVLDRAPLFPAGSSFFYTDTGYIVAGLAIESAIGISLYELAQRRVLDRLSLGDIEPQVGRRFANLVAGYTSPAIDGALPRSTLGEDGQLNHNPAGEWAGGGFVSSARDLARFIWTYASGRLCEADYLSEVLRFVRYSWAEGQIGGYGLGIFASNGPLGRAYGHGGYYPGYRSQMTYYPKYDVAVAYQLNSSAHFGGYEKIVQSRTQASRAVIDQQADFSQVTDEAAVLASALVGVG